MPVTCKKNDIFKAIFCVGYQSQKIVEYYETRKDFICIFSEEMEPLGTGGAVKNAIDLVGTDNYIVLNGDSIADFNLRDF
jgi:NDP-sugar pyrophosphorylase family protein